MHLAPGIRGSYPGAAENGLFAFRVVRQGASANGPAWAAPTIHRSQSPLSIARPVSEGPGKSEFANGETAALMNESLPHGCAGLSRWARAERQVFHPRLSMPKQKTVDYPTNGRKKYIEAVDVTRNQAHTLPIATRTGEQR